jgi:hypothetical protein
MNALATPDNTNCPCCAIEQGFTPNNTGDPRVCTRHYASENAEWKKHLAARIMVQRQYEGMPSFAERYQDNVEGYWEAL